MQGVAQPSNVGAGSHLPSDGVAPVSPPLSQPDQIGGANGGQSLPHHGGGGQVDQHSHATGAELQQAAQDVGGAPPAPGGGLFDKPVKVNAPSAADSQAAAALLAPEKSDEKTPTSPPSMQS